jgi:Secretion system C-terminal sorting domain
MRKNYFMLLIAALYTVTAFAQTDVVLWGGIGTKDGEFDGGLNNWTTKGLKSKDATKVANAVWTWSSDGTGKPGAYSTTQAVNSVSKANGAAIFNSDFLDNGGVQGAFEKGTCPAPNASELISPVIDVKNEPNVSIVFSQSFRNFSAKTYIQYSRDGGKTWSPNVAIILNDAVKANASNNGVIRIPLIGAGGTDKFQFKFVFDGRYYTWIIDDVSVIRTEDYNLRCNKGFFAIADNYSTPFSQVTPIPFLNDIENVGGKPQNATHGISVVQGTVPGTNVIFKDSLVYKPFPIDSTIENKLFAKEFTPKAKGRYTGTYSITGSQKDFDISDNTINFPFIVSDSTFAKESVRTTTLTPGNASTITGKDKSWKIGNVFYVPKGKGLQAGVIEFGIQNANLVKGQNITITLREWEDTNKDTAINDMSELTILGLTDYTVLGTEAAVAAAPTAPKLLKIKALNFANEKKPILLKDNTYYVAMLEYDGSAKLTDTPVLAASDEFDYGATGFIFNTLKDIANYTTVLDFTADRFYAGGYGRAVAPMIRWNVVPIPTSVEDNKLAESSVKIAPNPTSDVLNITCNFAQTMNAVTVRIMDASGKIVMTNKYAGIQNDLLSLDVANLANGVYQMNIVTETGSLTKSFVVAK